MVRIKTPVIFVYNIPALVSVRYL